MPSHQIAAAVLMLAYALSAGAQTGPVAGAGAQPTEEAVKALAAYPAQPEGLLSGATASYQRYVIDLPSLPGEEEARKVELIAGKVMTVDCNRQRLGGSFTLRDVNGWGYPYWVFESAGPARGFSTLMACPPGSQRQAFLSAPSVLARYNSRLPLVVYLPAGFELRWRMWQAGAEQSAQRR